MSKMIISYTKRHFITLKKQIQQSSYLGLLSAAVTGTHHKKSGHKNYNEECFKTVQQIFLLDKLILFPFFFFCGSALGETPVWSSSDKIQNHCLKPKSPSPFSVLTSQLTHSILCFCQFPCLINDLAFGRCILGLDTFLKDVWKAAIAQLTCNVP